MCGLPGRGPNQVILSDADWRRIRADAAALCREYIRERAGVRSAEQWRQRFAALRELERALSRIADDPRLGFTLTRGALRTLPWDRVIELSRAVAASAHFAELARLLGRLESPTSPDAPPVLERIVGPIRRPRPALRDAGPTGAIDRRGITRSDDLARMLPVEAAQLAHPVLRWLWHARRAERALLAYDATGVGLNHAPRPDTAPERGGVARPRAELGPVIVVVDTSGSMQGVPEELAKAVALRAALSASADGRRCVLFGFSGPGDVCEQEVRLGAAGASEGLAFLSASYWGGTDIAGPLERVLERMAAAEWSNADVLFLSDGQFDVPADTRERVDAARAQRGTRFHGVLVGGGADHPMATLFDPLHRISDFTPRGDSPPRRRRR